MNKKEILSRWHIIKKRIEVTGARAELDFLADFQIVVNIKTSQSGDIFTELIEWGYDNWDDVRACWQNADDNSRSLGISFKKPKDWKAAADGEEEDD